jgi:hypothetical protein
MVQRSAGDTDGALTRQLWVVYPSAHVSLVTVRHSNLGRMNTLVSWAGQLAQALLH